MAMVVGSRFDVVLVSLDPTVGSEMRKTRPCVVVSPDEMNAHLATRIVAPMTSRRREYPSRVAVTFKRKRGDIALDQLRTIDRQRIVKHLGRIEGVANQRVLAVLQMMFVL